MAGEGSATRLRTVGHRGASALAPQNTLLAFQLAIEHGLDLAELDVHLSKDGQLVVIHDSYVDSANGRQAVADLTARQLADVDVGDGYGVPRLVDVFDLARGRLGLYVELKAPRTGIALGELARVGASHDVELIAGSFSPHLVAEVREIAPRIPRSVLFRRGIASEMVARCARLDAAYAHPCFRPIERGIVEALHRAGLLVMSPHTNDRLEALEFVRMRVDVIASDDPRVLAGLR